MDTAVAIRTLEATYKSSADAAAVETMILRLTEKVWVYTLFWVLAVSTSSLLFTYLSIPRGMGKRSVVFMVTFISFLLVYAIASAGRSTSQEQGKGWQCYTYSCFNLEIVINHVKGMEILLASSHSFYASCTLYWHSVFRLRAFFVFSCGKFFSITCVIFWKPSVLSLCALSASPKFHKSWFTWPVSLYNSVSWIPILNTSYFIFLNNFNMVKMSN